MLVEPKLQLDLKSGSWNGAERLPMNAIGKVSLSFEEQAVFDTYEQNRSTGAFILIDPDTNNTVAGGMITGKRSSLASIHGEDARVVLSLPADLADQIMASPLFSARRDEVEIRRSTAGRVQKLIDGLEG